MATPNQATTPLSRLFQRQVSALEGSGRLPPGVRAVPVAGVAGSGRGGATRWVVPHASPEPGYTGVRESVLEGSARRGGRSELFAGAASEVLAGTRLPPGVRAFPVAAVSGSGRVGATCWVVPHGAPASAVAGSGRRGARRSVAAHAALEAGSNTAADDKDNHFYEVIETYTLHALEMLAAIKPPAALVGKAETLKSDLEEAVDAAKSRVPDKVSFVMDLLRNIYDVVNLVLECRSSGDFVPIKVCSATHPEDKPTLKSGESTVFTINVDDEENMIRSVVVAVGVATGYTAGCGWLSKAQMEYLKPWALQWSD